MLQCVTGIPSCSGDPPHRFGDPGWNGNGLFISEISQELDC